MRTWFAELARHYTEESRAIIREGYGVPSTLLVRFANDGIDETPEMRDILTGARAGAASGVEVAELSGDHLTPVGAESPWEAADAGASPSNPIDAVQRALWAGAQADIRRLSGRVVGWLDLQATAAKYYNNAN